MPVWFSTRTALVFIQREQVQTGRTGKDRFMMPIRRFSAQNASRQLHLSGREPRRIKAAPSVTAGRTVAPWDSAAAKASLVLECSERDMLPIHVGQEIMLRVPPSAPSAPSAPPSPWSPTLPLNKGPFIAPFMPQPSLFCLPAHLPLVCLKQIPFLPPPCFMLGELAQRGGGSPHSEPVAADCIPVCHLAAK